MTNKYSGICVVISMVISGIVASACEASEEPGNQHHSELAKSLSAEIQLVIDSRSNTKASLANSKERIDRIGLEASRLYLKSVDNNAENRCFTRIYDVSTHASVMVGKLQDQPPSQENEALLIIGLLNEDIEKLKSCAAGKFGEQQS